LQLYRVEFQTHYGSEIDIGDVLVCAMDRESAAATVMQLLQLPTSRTQYSVSRLKPNLYEIQRRRVPKNKGGGHGQSVTGGPGGPTTTYRCEISATVSGKSEQHAIRRLAESLYERGKGPGARPTGQRMMVALSPVGESKPRQ
jgi:hypothetical protein